MMKALSDVCEGSKSARINEVGKDEDLENRSDRCYIDGSEPFGYYERKQRAHFVEEFIYRYKFTYGEKICIHPYGPPVICSSEFCFNSAWVGVHGMQSICMVTRRDMDMTRLPPPYQRDFMKNQNMLEFARAAISEVECLRHKDVVYYDDAFRRCCTGLVKDPFAVVSLGQDTREESGYKDWKPLRYLNSVMSSDLLHTHYGIIRVAIKAYQLFCPKELRADDIWVTIMDASSGSFDDLPMDIIGEQLDLVNGLSSEKDLQKPLFEYRRTFDLPMDIIGEQLDLVNGLSSEKDLQKPLFEYRRGSLQGI